MSHTRIEVMAPNRQSLLIKEKGISLTVTHSETFYNLKKYYF